MSLHGSVIGLLQLFCTSIDLFGSGKFGSSLLKIAHLVSTSGSHDHKIDVCMMLCLHGTIHELLNADEDCVANYACRGLKENIEKELSAWREEDSRIILNLRKEEEKLFRTEEVREQRGTKAANVHKYNHLVLNVFKILVPKRENNSLA
uniref:Uncharacterized protein n=1 Tax=Glossina palpalis gambiensis TaxID=67801 RepID=A0A1B0BAQ3_9MUSC